MRCDPYSFITGDVKLAPMPQLYYQLLELLENPYSNFKDISNLMSKEPSAVARVLRIANSSLYNCPRQISTITEAIMIIGTQQIKDLILAYNLITLLSNQPSKIDIASFWKHSIACGIAARNIASQRNEPNIEHYYVLGLMHDIGRLLMYQKDSEECNKALEAFNQDKSLLHEAEDEFFGCNHAEVGCALLEQWNLPQKLWEPIKYHHAPDQATLFPDSTAIIHFADIIGQCIEFENADDKRIPPLNPEAWSRIGLSIDQIEPMFDQIKNQCTDAVKIFLH
jgi:putative nucleotidyltransferase with HDIG domain